MTTPKPTFPCRRIPDEPAAARLLGLYPQVQEGRLMQRVKVPGGWLTADQWRAVARIDAELAPAAPLHLTCRQDVELHDLTADAVPAAQRLLAESGLSGLGACGDTLRNITVCPCSGLRSGLADLADLAWGIRRLLEDTEEGVFALPRKFKVSFSACPEACAQPWLNDLGFIACRRDGRWGFRVVVGGSLGPRPGTGMELRDWLEAGEAAPMAIAAVRVFAAQGDRKNRAAACLRHVRQRIGDEAFKALVEDAFAAAKRRRAWPDVILREVADGFDARITLTFPNGDVLRAEAEAIAELAGDESLRVRIDTHHRVVVFGRDLALARQAVDGLPALRRSAAPQACVVACPGKRWCKRALTDTNALAGRVRAELADKLPPGVFVCVSGCPNNCAHSAVADIGLVGVLSGGEEAYNLLVGGGMGRTDKLARLRAAKLPPNEVIAAIGRGL